MKIFLPISITILLISFSFIQIDKEELPEYFWELDNYENPKVLIYDTYVDGNKSNPVYFIFEKISKKKLRLTKFNHQFKNTQIIEDAFKKDGVYLSKVKNLEDTTLSKMTKMNINQGYIFPKNYSNNQLTIEIEFDSQLKGINKIESKTNWGFVDTTYIKVNNEDLKTIIAEGESTITFHETAKTQTIKEKVTTWYTKGIGITKIRQISPYWNYEERFVKIISIEAFNKLKSS